MQVLGWALRPVGPAPDNTPAVTKALQTKHLQPPYKEKVLEPLFGSFCGEARRGVENPGLCCHFLGWGEGRKERPLSLLMRAALNLFSERVKDRAWKTSQRVHSEFAG